MNKYTLEYAFFLSDILTGILKDSVCFEVERWNHYQGRDAKLTYQIWLSASSINHTFNTLDEAVLFMRDKLNEHTDNTN
jgi:hypothetical protein